MNQTILIVEDEPKIVEFIKSYIENAGYQALVAENGRDALSFFRQSHIDLVLLDLMLPDLSGESICKVIRQESNVPIIMITAKSDESSIIAGLNMGADDYITKPFSPRQLIARIQALFRRSHLIEDRLTLCVTGPFQISEDDYSILLNGYNLSLTATEYNLFMTLLKRPSKVFTREELATIAFSGTYEGYNRSMDSHIKNIRNKIAKHSTTDYIRTVRGIGYQYYEEEGSNSNESKP